MRHNVFIDMDGVLCDFIGGFRRKFGVDFHELSEQDAWIKVKAEPNLWLELDPFPAAIRFFKDVWAHIPSYQNPMILTAVPKSSFIESAKNKKAWVRKHLWDEVVVIPCIGGYNKAGYIQRPGDILVDDMYEKNLVPWMANGGTAVHHVEGTLYDTTYAKLLEAAIS